MNEMINPSALLSIAVEKGADLEKLEKLMELQERWEAKQSEKSYIKAMSGFREKCPTIDKTRTGHNCNYSGLAETIEQIKKLLSEYNLSHAWKTDQSDDYIAVTCCVTHIDGHKECTTLKAGADGTGSKNNIQAIGSTISYLERYTLFAILGLASKEMDNDAETIIEYINAEQVKTINDLIKKTGSDEKKFLKYLKAESVEKINVAGFEMAVKALNKKRAKK